MKDLELELKNLIVESLMLEDVQPQEIDSDQPLFVEGLRLDSVDALELGMALSRRYGMDFKADNPKNEEIFRTVRSLAAYVQQHRSNEGDASDSR